MQKKHRIFIAINLPGDIKKHLARYQEKWADLPAVWTPQENLHVTLVFLGDLTDEELGEVCVVAKEVAAQHEAFEINVTGVGYGPDEKIPPRFIWAGGEKSQELSELKRNLENAFFEKINFKPDTKIFAPHITMARISTFAWRQINPDERPEVGEVVDIQIPVESIDVMESELRRGGPQYTLIESLSLKD